MRRPSSLFLRFCVILGVLASASGGARAQAVNQFLGWKDAGASQYFPDPVSACRDQWMRFTGGVGTFYGAYPSPSRPSYYYCSWAQYAHTICTWNPASNDRPEEEKTRFAALMPNGVSDWKTQSVQKTAIQYPYEVYQECAAGALAGFGVCTSEPAPPCPTCPKQDSENPNPSVGNPVALKDGAKTEAVTDYATGDGLFLIERNYRNLPAYMVNNGLFWPPLYTFANNGTIVGSAGGWRFNFEPEIHLRPKFNGGAVAGEAVAALHLPDGTSADFRWSATTLKFEKRPDGVPNSRYVLEMTSAPPADWTVLTSAQSTWRVTDVKENRVWNFRTMKPFNYTGTDAHLIARPTQMSAQGYVWNYNYDANNVLTSIVDSYGRTFGFTWNYYTYAAPPTGCPQRPAEPVSIAEISLPGGGKLRYTYAPILGPGGVPQVVVRRMTAAQQLNSSGTVVDSTTYQYEDTRFPDFLTGVTDGRGVRYATFAYDGYGRAVSTEHAGGQDRYTIAYSVSGNLYTRRVTNPLGKIADYVFESPYNAHQVRLKNVNGVASASCPASASAYTYDANSFIASETDEEGRVTAYVRDAMARPTSITRGSGTPQAVTTTFTWHPTLNIPTQVVQPGAATNVTVGATGLITQISKVDTTTQTVPYSTNGQTRTTAYGYNTTGKLTSVDGPLAGTGDSTLYAYVASGANAGNLQTITNEMGKVTTVTAWNGRGQPTSITDPNGVVTTLAYDPARGLLTQMNVDTAGTPATTTIAYDPVGQITKITLPNGAFESYAYDNARRLTTITNSAGETITYVRDANGDATSVTVKRANATVAYSRTRAFDELGRMIRSIGALSQTYQFAYDKTDNLTKVTDPRSNLFQYSFDPLNRLISETDEENKTVNLTRNGIDAVTLYTDARNLSTSYIRNGFGEVIQEVSPDRGTITYWRDARGLVTQRTDARGVATYYSYDNAGRLTGKTYSGSTAWQGFNWDATAPDNKGVGRLVGVYSEAGVNWRAFDTKGRIWVDYRTNNPAPAVATQYSYDAAGNVTGIIYPSGRIVTYARDAMGRVSSVTTQQNAAAVAQTVVWNLVWNPYGPLASMSFGYGGVATFTADTDYRITRVQVGSTSNLGGTLDRSLSWTGDIVNSIIDNVNPGTTPGQYNSQSQSFTYTPTRRLATASGYYGPMSWTYDANGNRLTETSNGVTSTYAYPAGSNRLTSVTPSGQTARSFTYDASGDITTDSRAGALGMTYQYDVEGRLSKAFQTNAPGQGGTYGYDALARLASRTYTSGATTATTLYVHDLNDHIIAETDTAGVTRREYLWVDDLPVAVVDGVNTATPTLYYVHTDHLGRPVRMLAQNWAWVWDVIYSPFGATAAIFDATTKLDMRFPGQWFQLESALAYNWHRHYDATLGRYVQPDPIGYAGGANLFAYANNSPFAYMDRDGSSPIAIIGLCMSNPVACAGAAAIVGTATWMMAKKPEGIKGKAEGLWDKYCSKSEDPCKSLKDRLREDLDMAELKQDAMRNDNNSLYGGPGWSTHANDITGRLGRIENFFKIADAIGCDVSAERARAASISIPAKPDRLAGQ